LDASPYLTAFTFNNLTNTPTCHDLLTSVTLSKVTRDQNRHKTPIRNPMNHNKKHTSEIDQEKGIYTSIIKLQLQQYIQLLYRQAIRELLFASITYKPEMLYSIPKLSQYINNPTTKNTILLSSESSVISVISSTTEYIRGPTYTPIFHPSQNQHFHLTRMALIFHYHIRIYHRDSSIRTGREIVSTAIISLVLTF